jgi:formylmethanofuran dehydrogenase subunit C
VRTVTLSLLPRKKPFLPIEAEQVLPENLAETMEIEIFEGNKCRAITDLFSVAIEGGPASPEDTTVVLSGDTGRIKRVGEYMKEGLIRVEGDIGMHCGNFMEGGSIEVLGNAGGWLGREMKGGRITCHGNAGHFCGSGYRGGRPGMRGGTIEIMGNSGDFTGDSLSGGEIIVHGNAGDFPGAEMRAGSITISGDCWRPGANMKGGTIRISGLASGMLPTFEPGEKTCIEGRWFQVFTGDIANRGKGSLQVVSYTYDS